MMGTSRHLTGAACLALAVVLAMGSGAAAQVFTNTSLSQLPYAPNVFEPSIDNETMVLHWTRHANAFVTNLNAAIVTCPTLKGMRLQSLVKSTGATKACSRTQFFTDALTIGSIIVPGRCPVLPPQCWTAVRNAAGGLWNHGLFFLYNLAPAGSQTYNTDASAGLKGLIRRDFGSFDAFKANFSSAATAVFGSGWAWLVWDPEAQVLKIATSANQDNPYQGLPERDTGLPILGLDVWEHAYYLKYYNVRPSYITNFFNVINWRGVSQLLSKARAGTYDNLNMLRPASNWATSG